MKSRIVMVFIFFALLWVLLLARAAYLQILPNARLAQLQRRQFETTVTLQSRRGAIFDRNGQELAVSLQAYSLFVDPGMIERPRKLSRQLAPLLGVAPEPLAQKILLSKGKRFLWIKRQLPAALKDQISELKIRGLGFVPEAKRVYPNGRLAANVLGFVGQEGQGLEGIEARFDGQLRSRRRQVSLPRDARGRPLIVNGQFFSENLDGSEIQLTLDRELQFVLERELAQVSEREQADAAIGIVIDAKSAEIRAMAQVPSFDPNDHSADRNHWRNRAVADTFEPGSVLKPLAAAAALEQQIAEPNSRFYCERGEFKVGGHVIHEAEAHEKYEWLSLTEILAFSSNIGITKLAFRLGQQNLFAALKSFGLGEKTGIELLGEARGQLHELPWRPHHFASISFGQGVSTTALQIANSYLTLANSGVARQPLLVKSVRDLSSGEKQEFKSRELGRVISASAAEKLTLMLNTVTERGGTGYLARVPGYPVAGKTGTAQKAGPGGVGYLNKTYVVSFAGIVPAGDPHYVIYIAVDHPRKNLFASAVAAPVFAKVAQFALRHERVPPAIITESNLLPLAGSTPSAPTPAAKLPAPASDRTRVPNLRGLSLRELYARARELGFEVQTIGGGWVSKTEPAAGEPFQADRRLRAHLDMAFVNEE